MNFEILETARHELDEAITYYNRQQPELGVRFYLKCSPQLIVFAPSLKRGLSYQDGHAVVVQNDSLMGSRINRVRMPS